MEAQEKEVSAEKVMESLGEPETAANEAEESHGTAPAASNDDKTLEVQKRFKRLKRQHEREIHELHARIADMQTQINTPKFQSQQTNSSTQPSSDLSGPVAVDELIHRAVSNALNHRDMEERKAKEAQQAAHMQMQYADLRKHLDNMSEKYDDFHDVVYAHDTQITPVMRDYAMTLPKKGAGSAGEVLYHLAKNPNELERISKLHPITQASEMAKLSHALISGNDGFKSSGNHMPLGQIKTNPVNHSGQGTTDRTPVSEIAERMRKGTWK